MEQVVKRDMTEHDENGVVTILSVFGRPVPDLRRKLPKPLHHYLPALRILCQRPFQVHAKEHVVRFVPARVVGPDQGFRLFENLIKSAQVQSVDLTQISLERAAA